MRTIIVIFGLLCAVGARGQIYLNSYAFQAPAGGGLLLDDYPNAAAAYSLRLLRTAYTGNCIEVRRASDNALQDIGFSGGVLDTAALKTHCAGTDCFVRTWYDQSGNARNGTQTTNANQPRIVLGGVVDRTNGLPAMIHDGTDVFSISFPAPNTLATLNTFNVYNRIADNVYIGIGNSSNTYERLTLSNGVQAGFETTVRNFGAYTTTGLTLTSYIRSSDVRFFINGVQQGSTFPLGTLQNQTLILLHGFGGSRISSGNSVFEVIVFGVDQATNRTAIETNIRNFHGF